MPVHVDAMPLYKEQSCSGHGPEPPGLRPGRKDDLGLPTMPGAAWPDDAAKEDPSGGADADDGSNQLADCAVGWEAVQPECGVVMEWVVWLVAVVGVKALGGAAASGRLVLSSREIIESILLDA